MNLLRVFLAEVVRTGRLEVQTPSGRRFSLGDGMGETVAIRLADNRAIGQLILNPSLAIGELYMDRRLEVTRGTIFDLMALAASNLELREPHSLAKARTRFRIALRRLRQRNGAVRARRNVAHHYDLDHRLYELFLDEDRQYSCAYFQWPRQSLEQAQLAKKRHISAKLLVEPGQRVLDIGSGWGGLALYMAKHCGAEVTGITLSEEQHAAAAARARESRLERQVKFLLQDYRTVEGTFDRIVSVGMFEHVGVGYYDAFFKKAAGLLADDGVMLLHSIGRVDGPGASNPWIDKYIFPGGYIPALSEVLPAVEKAGLFVTDVEILRLHYAETLRQWRERFFDRRREAEALYDERFCRMWEFYLAACECAFRHSGLMVFQMQLAKRQDAVPLTRDYITARERALETRDTMQANANACMAAE